LKIPTPDKKFFERKYGALIRLLKRYHRYRVVGIESVPTDGPAIVVSTHSAVTYDIFLAQYAIFEHCNRIGRMLGDDIWFQQEPFRTWMYKLGTMPASPGVGLEILRQGELLGICPGGMREALRPSTQRFQVDWKNRYGFVKLWMQSGVPIILFTCPRADLAWTVYDNLLTRLLYNYLHFPLFIARGIGPTPLPRPEPFTAYFSQPIPAPKGLFSSNQRHVQAVYADICSMMAHHIQDSLKAEELVDISSDS
jgi:1-acyl-sn-glycerol-3-phosphate acyltransferase